MKLDIIIATIKHCLSDYCECSDNRKNLQELIIYKLEKQSLTFCQEEKTLIFEFLNVIQDNLKDTGRVEWENVEDLECPSSNINCYGTNNYYELVNSLELFQQAIES